MKTRRWMAAFTLALGCTLMAPLGAQAEPSQNVSAENPQVQGATIVRTGGKTYLYDKSSMKPVTGKVGIMQYPAGSGNYYYLTSLQGEVQVGRVFTAGGNYYYADNEGILATGFTTVGSNTYYFRPGTFAAVKKWLTIDGRTFYFSKKNAVQKLGFVTIKKKTYYFNPYDNGARSTGWIKVNGKWYYMSSVKGVMLRGIVTDKSTGLKYYLGKKGYRKTGKIKVKGKYYYFDKKIGKSANGFTIGGAMTTGWRTHKGKYKSYYDPQTGAAATGWTTIAGKRYYFTAKGYMKTGWASIGGKKYYLDKDGQITTGLTTIGGKQYYFDSTGVMQTGQKTIDNVVYTFAATGEMTGKQPVATGPWSIKVNQTTNVVTIYRGSTPIKAMLCSVGLGGATPTGTFRLSNKKHWQPLFGTNGYVYGQYTSTITGNILFHSVYYLSYRNDNSLATAEYNKLGQAASHGCVRLSCGDAYYIYTQVPNGTPVTIFYGSAASDPLGKPSRSGYGIPWSGNYDPTDPIRGD